jgi:8-oxo-dGTP pyrophosphatase MutT (NUDIX family)
MHLFIHQYPIEITQSVDSIKKFQKIIDLSEIPFSSALFKGLSGVILLHGVHIETFQKLIYWLDKNENYAIQKLIICVENEKEFKKELEASFEIVRAAGGVITHQEKCLMIFRRGKWDLPKGKIDEGENSQTAAVREVKEECNIEAQIQQKVCTTWHHYWSMGKIVLKKTKWYLMQTSTPDTIAPQKEEDIEAIVWMEKHEVYKALSNSFVSINYVIDRFYALETLR